MLKWFTESLIWIIASLPSNGHEGIYLQAKHPEHKADHSTQFIANVKNASSWQGTKAQGQIYFLSGYG